MKTLLRSSLLALLAVGAFAGVASQSTAKFGTALGQQPTNCFCRPATTAGTTK